MKHRRKTENFLFKDLITSEKQGNSFLQLLFELSERYICLPLDRGELASILKKTHFNYLEVYRSLEWGKSRGLSSIPVMGRYIVYLEEKKLRQIKTELKKENLC